MNIFLFNKSLRLYDNTTLIEQMINEKNIIPFFIFTEQINKNKNKYYSENSVQFMCESLIELQNDIKKHNGKLYFFHSENFINIFKEIDNINSIGTNFDYSPYAINRQNILKEYCDKNNIKFYIYEDHILYNILDNKTLKKDGKPYTVFTPFKNHCLNNLNVAKPNKFNKFIFIKNKELKNNKYYINKIIDYDKNENINILGGRNNGLLILKNIKKFSDYKLNRDYLIYNTTFLSAHNHFGTLSIREIYNKMIKYKLNDLIDQLIWRDFYYNLYYHHPYMLNGQINNENKSFKPKYDKVKWSNDKILFNKWCSGNLGIPICDAGMRQLNKTGFMHNRLRMICANILTKLLLISWRWGEKYFATKLVDYDCIQNSAGWQWTCCGIDPQQVFRIFNPQIQNIKFDSKCIFIKKYIPELENISNEDIYNWDNTYNKYDNINYSSPSINYKNARENGINEFKKINKYK
jgi:deoxyribodipyrimidine photo-lyase